jgi:3-deoxy-D-manno-octulosonic-acid transferase
MIARLLYALLWIAALPLVLLRLLWRARKQPAYLRHLGERFGAYAPSASTPVIWLHAVSVGETRAAAPLIEALLQRWPAHNIVLTHMTPSGRATAQELFGNQPRVRSAYLPYDISVLSQRFLRHFDPAFGVIMETELWPALLAACRQRGIPVVLANARLSARSARRYARWPALTRATLGALTAIGCQTEADQLRLQSLGAAGLRITGNIKFDITPPPAQIALGEAFRKRFAGRPVILAASTRDGEERLILTAFAAESPSNVLLALVPRHPQRFDDVAALVAASGLKLQRRSDDQPVRAETRVWLGDTMGEMFAYFTAADIALIGGSWLPFGGQNLIEACAVGTPVILGPHTYNFALVAEQAIACDAAARAPDVKRGIIAALALLTDSERRDRAGTAGREFALAHRGATARTLALIEAVAPGD